MKILITGASGFIGGFLVEEALRRGYEVWAGVRKSSDRSHLRDARIQFIDLYYTDLEKLTKQLRDFANEHGPWDFIIHNAGLTKTTNRKLFYEVNAENTHRFLLALNAAHCEPKKFLLMSSLSSFGMGDEKTFRPIRLDDPQKPNTAYGKSKLIAENYVRSQTAFPYVILRPTGVYGPGEKDYFVEIKSIQSGFDFATGYTPQRITFIYVKDLATAAFLALENGRILNREYFVGDGDIYTDEEFANLLQELLGKKWVFHLRVPLRVAQMACACSEWLGKLMKKSMTLNSDKFLILKQRNWICDVQPLRDDLGFKPQYNLRQGLEESIRWYREHGWL